MHDWMRRILDQDNVNPSQRFQNAALPPAAADITLSILNSSNQPIIRIKYRDAIPVALTDIQFQTTSGGDSFLTFIEFQPICGIFIGNSLSDLNLNTLPGTHFKPSKIPS